MQRIPTNRAKDGKVIYAENSLLNSLATFEQSKQALDGGYDETSDYYWYNNSAWDKNEPIGIMTKEDAFDRSSKGCAFIDFEDTIPALTKSEFEDWHRDNFSQEF